MSTFLTWTVPLVLLAAAMEVARQSIRLAPGEVPGSKSLFSTPALDLVLMGLAVGSCVACFVWPRSALVTAGGFIAVLWYYSELYLHRSTDPLAGLVYLLTAPLAGVCAICGLAGFLSGRSRRARAVQAATVAAEAGSGQRV
jgi:hypothetical protein